MYTYFSSLLITLMLILLRLKVSNHCLNITYNLLANTPIDLCNITLFSMILICFIYNIPNNV